MTDQVFLPHPLPRHLSHSQCKTIKACGEAYRLERVLRVPSAPNLAALGGKAFHTATQYTDLWDAGPNFFLASLDTADSSVLDSSYMQDFGIDQADLPTAKNGHLVDHELAALTEAAAGAGATDGVDATPSTEVKNLWAFCLEREIQSEIAGLTANGTREHPYADPATWRVFGRATKAWPEKENLDWWNYHGPIFIQRWMNFKRTSGWTVAILDDVMPAVEVDCGGMLGSVPLKGSIDVIMLDENGQPVVVDKKTNSRIPQEPDQLGTYSVMLEAMGFPKPQWGVYWWSRNGETGVRHDLSGFTYESLGRDYAFIKAMRDEGRFTANTSSTMCSYCSVRRYCSAKGGDLSHLVPSVWEMGKLSIQN